MKMYEITLGRYIEYLAHGDDDKHKKIEEDLRRLILLEIKPELYNTHVALIHCKSFEEIAPKFSDWEKKKKPLTPDAIRKRYERLLKIIKDYLEEKYGESRK